MYCIAAFHSSTRNKNGQHGLVYGITRQQFGAIFPRSGISAKKGLAPTNKVGVCDSDYRGKYVVSLHNHSNKTQYIDPGERIAQLVVIPYVDVKFDEVDELSDTERGDGGFGSTGT